MTTLSTEATAINKSRSAWAVLVAFLLVLFASAPAAAHAELISSNPQQDQVLTAPPTLVALHFSENVAPKLSHFFLTVPAGTRTEVQAQVSGQDVTLNVGGLVPQGTAAAGKYVVDGQVTAADDGHQSSMNLSFTVQPGTTGTGAPTTAAPGTGSTGQVSGPSTSAAPPARTATASGNRLWTYVLIAVVAVAAALSMRRRRS